MHIIFWLENLKGRRPLERLRCRWEYNIRMDLQEIGWEDVNWIHLPQNKSQWKTLVNMVINLWIP
jgi:hypothetical protein